MCKLTHQNVHGYCWSQWDQTKICDINLELKKRSNNFSLRKSHHWCFSFCEKIQLICEGASAWLKNLTLLLKMLCCRVASKFVSARMKKSHTNDHSPKVKDVQTVWRQAKAQLAAGLWGQEETVGIAHRASLQREGFPFIQVLRRSELDLQYEKLHWYRGWTAAVQYTIYTDLNTRNLRPLRCQADAAPSAVFVPCDDAEKLQQQ